MHERKPTQIKSSMFRSDETHSSCLSLLSPPRCPGSQVTVTDDSGLQRCVPSPCAPSSCRNGGICHALSPDSYQCRCQEGFRGQRCELGQVKGQRMTALSPSSILAISMCLLVFIGKRKKWLKWALGHWLKKILKFYVTLRWTSCKSKKIPTWYKKMNGNTEVTWVNSMQLKHPKFKPDISTY